MKKGKINITHLLSPHWKALGIAFVAVIGESGTDLLEPWPLKIIFDYVLSSKQMPAWMASLVHSTLGDDKLAVLSFAALVVVSIAIVGAISSYTEDYLTTSVGQWVMHDLRRTVYHHIQRLSLAYHDKKRTGDLISRVTSDIDAIQSLISNVLLGMLVQILTLLGMIGVMFYLNWRFTLIALSVAPALFLIVYSFTRRIKQASRAVRKKEGEVISVLQEVLSSIRVVQAFTREDYEQRRFEQESIESVGIALRARNLKDMLVRNLPGARKAPRFKGEIEFDHVTFGYEEGRTVLQDLNLKIEPGQLAALVGPTGAGKTTVISLIPRFYDPASGHVKIDGEDVRSFKIKSLRQQISFVLQESLLFRAPVWQNIAYGRPEATRDEIVRAARLANAHEFIEKMSEGYNTLVGERGVTLSGGQRQRIAIARAIIRRSPILILDEPTSGLDAASEELVFSALGRLMEGKTSIVIAHRLATIRRADVIFVINEGRVVESGTHHELLARGGLYAELYEIQFRKEEMDDLESVSFSARNHN